MVKKTVVAIVAVVLLVAVFASASYRYGGYMPNRYFYYPETVYPSYVTYPPYSYYQPPSVAYPYSFLNEQNFYRYNVPMKTYQTYTGVTPRQQAGMLCGYVGSSTFECDYGLFCDYSGTVQDNVGVCRRQ